MCGVKFGGKHCLQKRFNFTGNRNSIKNSYLCSLFNFHEKKLLFYFLISARCVFKNKCATYDLHNYTDNTLLNKHG